MLQEKGKGIIPKDLHEAFDDEEMDISLLESDQSSGDEDVQPETHDDRSILDFDTKVK